MFICPHCQAEQEVYTNHCMVCGQPLPPPSSADKATVCPVCGWEHQTPVKFCGGCGAVMVPPHPVLPVVVTCPVCGLSHEKPVNFCHHCGTALVAPKPVYPVTVCDVCGRAQEKPVAFCGHCGAAFVSRPKAMAKIGLILSIVMMGVGLYAAMLMNASFNVYNTVLNTAFYQAYHGFSSLLRMGFIWILSGLGLLLSCLSIKRHGIFRTNRVARRFGVVSVGVNTLLVGCFLIRFLIALSGM